MFAQNVGVLAHLLLGWTLVRMRVEIPGKLRDAQALLDFVILVFRCFLGKVRVYELQLLHLGFGMLLQNRGRFAKFELTCVIEERVDRFLHRTVNLQSFLPTFGWRWIGHLSGIVAEGEFA